MSTPIPLFLRIQDEADQCRHDGAADIAALLDEVVGELDAATRDAQRYKAFFANGGPVCFMGLEYRSKSDCDAAIDAAIAEGSV